MPFITANPNEYLIVGHQGQIINRGVAARAFLWPGTPYVLLSSTQQEAPFEMTQESRDGIPLRFKGIVVYRVVTSELTAQLFNFADRQGHAAIQSLLSHICLGELRALVAQMTMSECIEQRKTTLTDAVAAAVQQVVQGQGERPGWGITLDVVQVARFPVLVWLWIPCSISLRQKFFGRSATSLPTNLVFRIRHSGLTASGHHSPRCFASPMCVQSPRSPF